MARKRISMGYAEVTYGDCGVSTSPHTREEPLNKVPEPTYHSLTISRNKHWRYISAFHGPWLQLPHEILETLTHSNYLSPRPRQTDPAVLYDLLKVRKLVDEAADLAVRAQNGTASSALNSDSGLLGAALGLNTRGAGANARLSAERKYRMRELAVQKLALAYRLDEVAASVATMQSASALENVASLVLQRAPSNRNAKYVHFFHEKIPSRMMAEYTPLTPLDEVVAVEPGHAAPFRTRALTKIFKEDYSGAVRDLTEALTLCRLQQAKHSAGKNQLVSLRTARDEVEKRKIWTRDWMQENRVLDEDQPRGLELQLLFQRGNQYLTLACRLLRRALHCLNSSKSQVIDDVSSKGDHPEQDTRDEIGSYPEGLEMREAIRKYAKRALRDYTTFFSKLDYAYAPDPDVHNDVFHRDDLQRNISSYDSDSSSRVIEERTETSPNKLSSHALVRHQSPLEENYECLPGEWSIEPQLTVHDMSKILSSSPPTDLPPFPPPFSTALVRRSSAQSKDSPPTNHQEMITYHPLMPETLHSFLLTHCVLQTPPTTLHRLANNAARLARLADGYPFFLSARSPARADWAEILRRTGNWVGLADTWDQLCKTARPPGHEQQSSSQRQQKSDASDIFLRKETPESAETKAEKEERIHKESVMEALGDERVVDDESFQKAVQARETRAWREMESSHNRGDGEVHDSPRHINSITSVSPGEPIGRGKQGTVAKDEEYLIGTERAEAITKWVMEAPTSVDGPGKRLKKGKRKPKVKSEGIASGVLNENNVDGAGSYLEGSTGDLSIEERE